MTNTIHRHVSERPSSLGHRRHNQVRELSQAVTVWLIEFVVSADAGAHEQHDVQVRPRHHKQRDCRSSIPTQITTHSMQWDGMGWDTAVSRRMD